MLKIYIARHGQDEDNANGILNGHRDSPLTELGIEQAQNLALHIKKTGIIFSKIYSSPLIRAYSTASVIADTIKTNLPQKLPFLIERDFGTMTGEFVKNIEILCIPNIIKTEKVIYFLNPEGAETFPKLLERARSILIFIKSLHNDGNILLVCHGDVGKMIYAAYYDLDWKDVLTMFHFENSDLLLLSEDTSATKTHIFKTV